jgi:hypothetical protein
MKIVLEPKDIARIKKRAEKRKDSTPSANGMNSKAIEKATFPSTRENVNLIEQCRLDWDGLYSFRKRRLRSRKYYQGDQWHELIIGPNGRPITEEDYIKSQGKIPFKQNIIRQIVRNMLGQYRTNPSQSIVYSTDREKAPQADIMGATLDQALSLNNSVELDAAALEEFILSGMTIQKEMFSYWPTRDKEDLFVENINVNRIFFNSDVRDLRFIDLSRIGEVKDTTLERMIAAFGDTPEKEKAIREIYRGVDVNNRLTDKTLSTQEIDRLSFFYTDDSSKCRMIEVWYEEYAWRTRVHDTLDGTWQVTDLTTPEVMELNQKRIEQGLAQGIPADQIPLMEPYSKYEPVWKVKYLSPWGHCFYESETPYEHQEHPYTLKVATFLDGEVRGLVEDIIDQQRYINRLISMLDFIMGASAKGVLLVPEESIPDDMDINDFAAEWSKFNGVIKVKLKPGETLPTQVSANSTNIGAFEMLNLQLKLIMDIGGVGSAIQGQDAKSGTPSSLYAQMAQNSLINSRDMFDKFSDFKTQRDRKALKIIKQYYTSPRNINVGGRMNNAQNMRYTPDIADIDMEIKSIQGTDSPVYRAIIDDTLMTLLTNQLIDIKMFLEHTSLPFADKLLDSIQKREQEGGTAQIDPETAAQLQTAQAGAAAQNPKANALIDRMMKGAA